MPRPQIRTPAPMIAKSRFLGQALATLARQGKDFQRIIQPRKDDILFNLAYFLDTFDIRTIYPLLLFLLDAELSDSEWNAITKILESYLLRRAVCGWTTKNYNRIFLNITRRLRKDGASAATLKRILSGQFGESSGWPSDSEFENHWMTAHAYSRLNNPKMVYILRRVSNSFLNNRHEKLTFEQPLSIEHILPQSWIEHWPLSNGEKGLSGSQLWREDADPELATATRKRNTALQTFGNLTILTQSLNSGVRNSGWTIKKPEILRSSLLPLNQMLHSYETWDEETIDKRAKSLFIKAKEIWPSPDESQLLKELIN